MLAEDIDLVNGIPHADGGTRVPSVIRVGFSMGNDFSFFFGRRPVLIGSSITTSNGTQNHVRRVRRRSDLALRTLSHITSYLHTVRVDLCSDG